jgi:hypothetical protein
MFKKLQFHLKVLTAMQTTQTVAYKAIDGQSASLSWYQATIWDSRQVFLSPLLKFYLDRYRVFLWISLFDERMGPYAERENIYVKGL